MEFRPIGMDKGQAMVFLIKGSIGFGVSIITAVVDKVVVKKIFHTDNWDGVADILNSSKGS